MMALSATSRDGIELQSGFSLMGPQAILQGLRGPSMPNLVGTSLMGLGADGTVDTTAAAAGVAGMSLLGLIMGAVVTGGITAWMFSASRDGSNLKPGLVAGGTYLAGGLLLVGAAALAR